MDLVTFTCGIEYFYFLNNHFQVAFIECNYHLLLQTSTSRLVVRNIKPFQVSFKQSTPTYNNQLIIDNKNVIIDSNDSQMADISKERLKR